MLASAPRQPASLHLVGIEKRFGSTVAVESVVSSVFRGAYAAYQLHAPALGQTIYAHRQAGSSSVNEPLKPGDVLTAGWAVEDGVVVEDDA
jgi:putative spermidine/putrescine transport system ATP-binding protein